MCTALHPCPPALPNSFSVEAVGKKYAFNSLFMVTSLNRTVPPQGHFQQGMKETDLCRWANQNLPVVSEGENAECISYVDKDIHL